MTVSELLVALQAFPGDIPVVLCDWNEDYRCPLVLEPEMVQIRETESELTGSTEDRPCQRCLVLGAP